MLVNSSNFDINTLCVSEKEDAKSKARNIKRYDVCVNMPGGKFSPASFSLDYEDDILSGVYSTGLQQSKKFAGSRRTIPLMLDPTKKVERDFIAMIQAVESKLSISCGTKVKTCVNPYVDKEGKNKYSIWCNLIEGNNVVYTVLYDKDAQRLSDRDIETSLSFRPAIRLSLVYTEGKDFLTCKASLAEACVMETLSHAFRLLPVPHDARRYQL
jgi:hypothetical protein